MPNAILDPTGAVTSTSKPAAARAPRHASLKGARVGLLINTKQNAAPFLHEVGRLLVEKYGAGSVTNPSHAPTGKNGSIVVSATAATAKTVTLG